jgi:DNA-binding NtrC family response regulator
MSDESADQRAILVVDDDQGIVTLLRDIFEDVGFAVSTAATVGAARALLAGAPRFDVVLADVRLPDGSGEIVLQAAQGRGIPCVLMSGHPDVILNFAQGTPDFLAKPFKIDDLLRAVLLKLP